MRASLTLGQLEAIGAEVWGPTTEIRVRSERLVYITLVLAGREVEGLSGAERQSILAAAEHRREETPERS